MTIKPLITLENLNFGYRYLLFNSLSFSLDSENLLLLTGPNGSGKSTLLRLMAGLEIAQTGKITRSGLNEKELHTWQVACDQNGLMLNWTAKQNIDFFKKLAPARLIDGVALFESWKISKARIYQELPLRHYSSGMRRKLALALAFALKPQLLLLDEPTRSLDLESSMIFEKSLQYYLEVGGAVVMACHIKAEHPKCKKILELQLPSQTIVTLKSGVV